MSKGKKAIAVIGLVFLVLFVCWLALGRPIPSRIPPSNYGATTQMTEEENITFMQRALPPSEFLIWRSNWDLRDKDETWKRKNSDIVNQIRADFKEWQQMHDQLSNNDYNSYRKKYGVLFGDTPPNLTNDGSNKDETNKIPTFSISDDDIVGWKDTKQGISIRFTKAKAVEFYIVTKKNVGKPIQLYFNTTLIASPKVNEPIESPSILVPTYSKEQKYLIDLLPAGKRK